MKPIANPKRYAKVYHTKAKRATNPFFIEPAILITMLNRLQCAAALAALSDKLFPDTYDVSALAWETYQRIAADVTFPHRAQAAQASFLVPRWNDNLCDTTSVSEQKTSYTVIGVDGSQIYPDRHVGGAGCFLLNTGGVMLSYGAQSSATFFSEPRICLTQEIAELGENISFSPEIVDLLRENDELATLTSKSVAHKERNPFLLIDGTIIFWNLEGKQPEARSFFLHSYLAHLQTLYEHRIPCAGYISFPKSRDLINLTKLGLCRFATANCAPCIAVYDTFPCKQVDTLIDTHIAHHLLQPGQRTILFQTTSSITNDYPEHLRPHFCYLHVGNEIIRLEIPKWIGDDHALFDQLCAVAYDQAQKGNGYPVCLAEAHEQAVIKGPDRTFFYQLLTKLGFDKNKQLLYSQKSIKKRGIGI